MTVDSTGNTYVWRIAYTPYSSAVFHLTKFSPTGVSVDSAPVSFAQFAALGPIVIGKDGFIYVGVNNRPGNQPPVAWLAKYDTNLHQVWNHTFSDGKDALVALSVDVSGLTHVVVGTYKPSGSSLQIIQLNAGGVQVAKVENTDIYPIRALRVNGDWIVTGQISYNTDAEWGVYRESDGANLGGQAIHYQYGFETGISTLYDYAATVDSGDIFVALNIYSQTVYSSPGTRQFTLSRYSFLNSPGIARKWLYGPFEGIFSDPAQLPVNGANQQIFALAQPETFMTNTNPPCKMYLFNDSGITIAQHDVPYQALSLDANGYFSFGYDAPSDTVTVQRHDLNIADSPLWSTTYGGDFTQNTGSHSQVIGSSYQGNALVVGAQIMNSSTGLDLDVRKYVFGPTLAVITAASQTVPSGGTDNLKVQLTAAAPSGGLAVHLVSNNAKLLFSNNSQTITVAIPAGSIFVNVPVHAGTVTSNTTVLVQGDQNGVVKSAVLTVTP
jgi:hypothetical protein